MNTSDIEPPAAMDESTSDESTPIPEQESLAIRLAEHERNTVPLVATDLGTRKPYTGPNYLLRFPSELRIRIFELVYEDQILVVLEPLNGKEPSSPYASPGSHTRWHGPPATTRRYVNPRQKPPVNHGIAWRVPNGIPVPKWKTSLTGLLLVNKQSYTEAVPLLYRSCEFRLSNVAWARAFMNSVGRANLLDIRSIDFCLTDEHQDQRDAAKFHVTCARIVKRMPNIENIVLRVASTVDITWYEREHRNFEYEQGILLLGKLKHLTSLVVTKNVFNTHDLGVATDGSAYQEGPGKMVESATVKAVRDMILTGDHGILDERRRELERSGKMRR